MDSGLKARSYQIKSDYPDAIDRAGGVPVCLGFGMTPASMIDAIDRLDGFLFTGGDDLHPRRFDQPLHPKTELIDPDREAFELRLLAEIERRRLPVLGVCLGCQLMNVHRGGSLIQFLPDDPRPSPIEHRAIGEDRPRHTVRLDRSSRIGEAIGRETISVNTHHKQAIARLGRGLRISATAPDGIIEAIEDPDLPLFTAVQWHPERLPDEPDHLALFQMLIAAARQ